jgi:hypothetical protein
LKLDLSTRRHTPERSGKLLQISKETGALEDKLEELRNKPSGIPFEINEQPMSQEKGRRAVDA